MTTKTLIAYHGNCIDGFTAAWACRKHFGDRVEYLAVHYGENGALNLPDVKGRNVIFVDFCPKRQQLLDLMEHALTVRVYDHHKTAAEDCGDLINCSFAMERSGAGIAWDYFVGGPRPWLVNYVEDRDLWNWALEGSKEASAFIATVAQTFDAWDELSALSVDYVVQQGRGILRYIDRYVREMSAQARTVTFAGHAVPVVNAPYINTSELVGALAESAPFAVGWFQRSDGRYQYSLRSRGADGVDVSAIAKEFGGGGHRNAAGFVRTERVTE